MQHLLIPIDGGHEHRTATAVAQAVQLNQSEPCTVHLLRVRPAVSGHVAMLFNASELHALQVDLGQEELASARGLLDAAGLDYDCTVRIGRSAPTIAAVARELHCGTILFGEEQPGVAERLFGSMAEQVRHLLNTRDDPVVLGT